jgi:hypothetical protein
VAGDRLQHQGPVAVAYLPRAQRQVTPRTHHGPRSPTTFAG